MGKLDGKRIVLAVTGSIAAYKSAFLTRLLVKAGCEVQVLMTDSAKAFIAPLTLSTLSGKPVYSDIYDADQWNSHVDLGLWADAFLIAPCTAHTLAKCTSGQSDNLVLATYLSSKCPVFIAPAMDLDMWQHPATRRNTEMLQKDGCHMIPVGYGDLASGLTGHGRMAEPEDILNTLGHFFQHDKSLAGQKALVTAGPTYESIDPVRYIGNHSTGKMGICIANTLSARGAEVTLILGPSSHSPASSVQTIRVQSAREMFDAARNYFPKNGINVFAAAVADYTPKQTSPEKLKKGDHPMRLELERTPDIARSLGKMKKADQITVGFALETENPEENAMVKLRNKGFDMIVLNTLKDAGAGFGHETNKVSLIYPDNKIQRFQLKSKEAVSEDIVDAIAEILKHKTRD